ncbi:LTA synthase family protein [Falsibacillus pallidus]|uniref:Lipoteichoic acid synthase n=1 Tax=Falsibacillus pallidus TaxID=493781 RepID=A0A370GF61_9BACI|nr:LTA synthase family protein [Falsibacillus pallidus]RDI42301.1 lipoteichoic acid synthase [Falsibacillus pallidus]
MNTLKDKSRELMNHRLSFFFLAVVMFWIKTYAAYRIEFNLGIENGIQKFLLFFNPLSSAVFFLGFALFFKGKLQNAAIIVINFLLSFLLFANITYYRFFNDFITLPVLTQAKNNAGVGDSALALMKPWDVLYFTDTIILLLLVLFKVVKPKAKLAVRSRILVFASALLIFSVNLGLAEADRPELLTRTFDRNYLVKYLGAYNYTVYDLVQNARSSAQRALADSNDVVEAENYIKANHTPANPKYFGKAKGMNVIYISLESFQNFVIDYKINGQEVTPFLNSLAHDNKTFYFDNFFHQTGQGKTSDAEFMMENSLFPLPQGSVFTNKAQNTYQSAPAILKDHGYTSAVFHGNYKTFWNRDEMYKSMGYDKFFDATYYDMNDQDTLNYGLKDKPFFKESMPMLKELKQPFYTKFISLSNHFPFPMDEGDTDFPAGDFGDGVVNHYFQTAHYMDEALQQFFTDLKESGLADNTVVVMYGDHYGISENHNAAMSKVMGKDITPFENAQLQRVPLFISVPGVKGGQIHKYGGEVDVRPTLMHLLGVDTKDFMTFGSDLLSDQHRDLVPFRNGDFVSSKAYQINGTCYSNPDGEKVDAQQCKQLDDVAKKELELSDSIVYGDLLRFYTPPGFTPVDRSKYDYTNREPKNEQ